MYVLQDGRAAVVSTNSVRSSPSGSCALFIPILGCHEPSGGGVLPPSSAERLIGWNAVVLRGEKIRTRPLCLLARLRADASG